jgi:hypothetical protein
MSIGISERVDVGFCSGNYVFGVVVGSVCSEPVFEGAWGFKWVFGPAGLFCMTGLAATRVSASQMTSVLSLRPSDVVVTGAAIGIICVATCSQPCPLFNSPFFPQLNLLSFFNVETLVQKVQVWRIIRFGRADPIVLLFEIAKVRWKAMQESSGKHIIGHIVFNGLEISFDLTHFVCVFGHG